MVECQLGKKKFNRGVPADTIRLQPSQRVPAMMHDSAARKATRVPDAMGDQIPTSVENPVCSPKLVTDRGEGLSQEFVCTTTEI